MPGTNQGGDEGGGDEGGYPEEKRVVRGEATRKRGVRGGAKTRGGVGTRVSEELAMLDGYMSVT
eukprot:2031999-Prymnesium_polylepis.2